MANSIFITFAGANFAVPGQVAGDLFVAVNGTTITRLADAATGNVLLSGGVGAAPSYGKVGLTTHVSGTLAPANGGTGLASYAVGDLIYADGATSLAKLADVATGQVLVSGGVGVAPAWSATPTVTSATVSRPGIGTTSTDGVRLINSTAAAAGAQQYSPRTCWEGQGWKTDATAASQSVVFCAETQPVQGTAAPTGNWILKASINGGAFSTVGTFSSAGVLTLPTSVDVNGRVLASGVGLNVGGGDKIGWTGQGGWFSAADGNANLQNHAGSNRYDITLADWGTTLSAESVSIADAATLSLGAAPLGLLTITVGTDNIIGRFQLRGGGNAVVADDGNDAIFTTTKDTAASINVYFDTSAYFIQNTRGGARAVRALLIGA